MKNEDIKLEDLVIKTSNDSSVDYTEKVLEVSNLKKYFFIGSGRDKFTVPAVDGITFDIYKREVFGLVGESGCGKTTAGRTIIKLYQPTDGKVKLNGEIITAGYSGHQAEVKRLKGEKKHRILKLKDRSNQIITRKEKLERELLEIEHEKEIIVAKHKEKVKEIKLPISLYREAIYNIKNNYKLRKDAVIYKYNIDKTAILLSGQNEEKVEFINLKAISKKTYENKVSGLKDSAALTKEVQEARLLTLKENYEIEVKALEEEYASKIIKGEETRVSKEDVKKQISEIKSIRKEGLAKEKAAYLKEKSALVHYDLHTIHDKLVEEKNNHQKELAAINEKIKLANEAAKADIDEIKLNFDDNLTEEQKSEVVKIKEEIKEAILVEKEAIREIKSRNKSKESLRLSRGIQMVFQDPIASLNPRMTVKEIIGEGLIVHKQHSKEEIDIMVKEALELVGLSADYTNRYPHEFSGGQRQRIGLARALIMNPSFIIADEPISALDVSIQAQVINLLQELREELGLTILFIAHDLSVVRFFSDRIAVMYYGKIVELATSEELFAHPMHPYTISLLSAIPQPDPDYEKGRTRINYDPRMHDYRFEKPILREIAPGHQVLASDAEFEQMKKDYKLQTEQLEKEQAKANKPQAKKEEVK